MMNLVATVLLVLQKMAMINSACQFITSTDAGCDDDICIETWKDGFCQGIILKIMIPFKVSQVRFVYYPIFSTVFMYKLRSHSARN